jgi:hypothetical protein
MAYLYTHIRLDTNEVFYVGIGSDKDYSRAYTTHKLTNYLSKSLITKQNKIRHLKGFIWKYKQT